MVLPVLLPNAAQAVIEPEKIRGYLLSPSHPVGRFKATFFLALGYTPENWTRFRDELMKMAETAEAESGQASPFGQKYETRATITGPTGRSASIVAVWIVLTGEEVPKFLTAFPG